MDQDRVLSVFLHVIDYFMQWISATKHCLLVIEFGFQQPSFFQTNIGKDFVNKIYVRCCSNDLQTYTSNKVNIIEKPFVIHERMYRRLGLACDIESARTNYQKEHNKAISDFFLLHQCCLIVRDICAMIESCIEDIDTSIIPLQQGVPHVCL